MPTTRDPAALLDELAACWRLPALRDRVSIVTSGRLRTSLGLYDPRRRQIRLAAFLADAPAALFREVVVHELAHAAVHVVHGRRRVRPHGAEWKRFMRAAGLAPRARLPHAEVGTLLPAASRRARARWRHRCPVCEVSRLAGRPVRRWRCLACMQAGRRGELEITRVEPAARRAAR